MFENVLQKGKIGSVELRNRFVMPAMGSGQHGPKGLVGDKMIDYYVARARGGFGLIIQEFTGVDLTGQFYSDQLSIHSDDFIPGFKKLADAVHAEGAKIFMQLHHPGRIAESHVSGHPIVSSSAIAPPEHDETPREMTTQEVYDLIEKFGDAALRAKKAGYDGVELHGAHGYIIPQFMSAYVNKRTDEFGGDITSRASFPTCLIKNIKQKCGADFAVTMRFSADEKVEGAMKINEARVMAKLLEEAGADALHISVGAYEGMVYALTSYYTPVGFNTYAAEEIRKSVKIPVITVGRIVDPAMADAVIEDGMADFVSLGRASIADPEFPKKVTEGRIDEICPCTGCMGRCLPGSDPLFVFNGTTCSINPFSGRGTEIKIEPANKNKTIVVVGGGVGGLEAAWVSAARGHKVILLEKSGRLGGKVNTASIPPNNQGFARAVKYFITMCKKHGVDIHLNTEATADMIGSFKPDAVILCTGSSPAELQIPNDGVAVVQAVDILNGSVIPGKNVLVVGGGLVGLKTADFLLSRQRPVTVVEMQDKAGEEFNHSARHFLFKTLRDGGVTIMTGTKAERFTKDGAVCSANGGEITLSGYDMVVLAVGSNPYNPLEAELTGKVPEVYVIGDAKEARRIPHAVWEAAELATVI